MADKFVFTNFAVSTLRESVDGLTTSFQLNPADVVRFPSLIGGTKFPLILADSQDNLEIVYVTALDGYGLATVERARERTNAQSWLAGTICRHGYTAASIVGAAGLRPRGDYAPATNYDAGDVVTASGVAYIATVASINVVPVGGAPEWQVVYQPPTTGGAALAWIGRWSSGTTYNVGHVAGYAGRIWVSASAGNVGHAPVLGSAFWTPIGRWSGAGLYHPIGLGVGTNNYQVTLADAEAPEGLYDGLTVRFRAQTQNTSNCTLALVSGIAALPAKPLRFASGQELPVGYVIPGQAIEATYNIGTDEFIVQEVPGFSYLLGLLNATIAGLPALGVQTGTILPFGGGDADVPAGYLLCDGSALSQASYPALYAKIQGRYNVGGEPVGSFRLPNGKSRTPVGADNIGGVAAGIIPGHIVGSYTGEAQHLLTIAELAAHTHGITDFGHWHDIVDKAHNHTTTEVNHRHLISDPGHGHTTTDYGHTHTVPDWYLNFTAGSGIQSGTGFQPATQTQTTSGPTPGGGSTPSGVNVNGNTTGITATNYDVTGLTINNRFTGIIFTETKTTGLTATDSRGSSSPHNNLQPSFGVNWIIKT